MKMMFPDYKEGLLNLMSSIMKHYDCNTPYSTHPDVDKLLQERKYNNIFLVLIDGMGAKIIEKNLPTTSFIRQHLLREMTSVYPPTTAAATTIFDSGLAPVSSGWLGWFEYFKEIDDYRILFYNQSFYTHAWPSDNHVEEAIGYKKTGERIKEQGHGYQKIMPAFDPDGVKSIDQLAERIIRYSRENKDTFTYAYWDEFDSLMHQVGVDDKQVKETLIHIDNRLEYAAKHLQKEDLMIIIADHGQLNTTTNNIQDHPDFLDTLVRQPSIESRTIAFYVLPDKKDEFEKLFNLYYGEKFKLLSSEEFIKQGWLGPYEIHPRTKDFLGDYVALATDTENILYGTSTLIGQHAGTTEAEMMIPLVVYKGGN